MSISADPQDQAATLDITGETSPYPFFNYMRRTEPVWHGTVMEQHGATPPELVPEDEWVLFRYQDVFQAFRDDDKVFSTEYYDKTIGLVMGHTILAMSGTEHHNHRSLVAKAFRTAALHRWEPTVIRPVCEQLVDEIKNDGTADLVKAVTFEFPTRITAALLGLPNEDLDKFRQLSFDLISIPHDIEAGLRASVELHDYFLDQIEQRRRKMTTDIIGDLVSAEIDGQKLTDDAIIAFLRLLLPAGVETTYRSSGNLLYLLLTHPEQLEMVYRDRTLIRDAIEEALRYETPLITVVRTTTQEVDVGGTTIPKNAQVDLCMGSANRDETRWADPEVFDIRRERHAHMSFGAGEHMCMGMHLARLETEVMLNSLFDRVTDLKLAPDSDAKIVGLTFRSPDSLPVTFTPVT